MRVRNSLKRRAPFKDAYPIYLIVCEGEVTERQYFSDLRHLKRVPLTLKFIAGAGPATLVQKAASVRKAPNDYDRIWVVFDVDAHPGLAGAKKQAEDNGLSVIVSNPCFEL